MNEIFIALLIGALSTALFQFLYSIGIEAIYALRKHDKPLDNFIKTEKKKHNRDVVQEISLSVVEQLKTDYHLSVNTEENEEAST
jgi:hypothetical protein